jgi:hypothetical protein
LPRAQAAEVREAAWATFGWDDPDPAAVDEDTMLVLNLEQAGIA